VSRAGRIRIPCIGRSAGDTRSETGR